MTGMPDPIFKKDAMKKSLRMSLGPVMTATAMLLATTQLTACFPIMAGAVAGGVLSATDRRNTATQAIDRGLQMELEATLASQYNGRARVAATVYNRKVLLTGEARDEALRQQIEAYAKGRENVREVINDIRVASSPSLVERSEDAFITTKVKSSLIAEQGVPSNSIKVTTEANVVYLLGVVTEAEGERATNVARTVAGVAKVVKVFDYVSDAEKDRLDRMSTTQQSGQAPTAAPAVSPAAAPAPAAATGSGVQVTPVALP
jgi:osmotically-inducible protein OsmY